MEEGTLDSFERYPSSGRGFKIGFPSGPNIGLPSGPINTSLGFNGRPSGPSIGLPSGPSNGCSPGYASCCHAFNIGCPSGPRIGFPSGPKTTSLGFNGLQVPTRVFRPFCYHLSILPGFCPFCWASIHFVRRLSILLGVYPFFFYLFSK